MIYLRFDIAGQIYAFASNVIVEVIPCIPVNGMAHTSPSVVGTLNYRGTLIPVVDLTMLLSGQPSARYASTRIVIVNYRETMGETLYLALVIEQATETIKLDDDAFNPQVINNGHIPYSGAVTLETGQLLYRLEVHDILPPDLQGQLYPQHHLDEGSVSHVD